MFEKNSCEKIEGGQMKKRIGIGLLFFLFLGIVLFPIKDFLFSKSFTQKTLFLFLNEAESRPCGGFITAFGEGTFFPPSIDIRNTYDLEIFDFGENTFPLSKVSKRKKFWDLAYNPNPEACSQSILSQYNKSFNTEIKNVVLVNFSVIEAIFTILYPQKSQEFFDSLSQDVANVDRHDEETLSQRKTPLSVFSRNIIRKGIFSFWKWPRITQSLAQSIKTGELYISGISQEFFVEADDFGVFEWNLGGGKTSRLLKKVLFLSLREVSPGEWEGQGRFEARNMSGFNEPIGQYWKGVFEIKIPEIFSVLENKNTLFFETEIPPGSVFTDTFSFSYSGDLEKLSFFRPRGQELFLDMDISVYPQKIITKNKSLETKSNTASFFGKLEPNQQFSWEIFRDKTPPFLTFHKKISYEEIPEKFRSEFSENDFFVQIHFNEIVEKLPSFSAKLVDRQYAKKDIKEDLYLVKSVFTDSQIAAFLAFDQHTPQPRERYYLQLKGVQDVFGNSMEKSKNTVIEK